MGEGIDVDDAASDGKLARFVNVVRLVEAEAEQRLLHKHDIYALPYSKLQRLLLELLSGHDELAESLRIGDDEKRQVACRETRQDFGPQDFLPRIALSELYGSLEAAGEEEHVLRTFTPFFVARLAKHLNQVVIEVACFLLIVEDKDVGHTKHLWRPYRESTKDKRHTTSVDARQLYRLVRTPLQFGSKGLHARMLCKDVKQFLYLHRSSILLSACKGTKNG